MKRPKTLAEQIADLDDPAPREFDPEEDIPDHVGSGDESHTDESQEDIDGLDHYEHVGRSKLRSREYLLLGPQYDGSRTSRRALLEGEGNDDFPTVTSSSGSSGSSENGRDDKVMDVEGQSSDDDNEDDDEVLGNRTNGHVGYPMTNGNSSVTLSSSQTKLGDTTTAHSEHKDSKQEQSVGDSGSEFKGLSDAADEQGLVSGTDSDAWTSETGEGDSEEDEHDEEDGDDSKENGVDQQERTSSQRAELRKMMSEEQKVVVARIAEATRADAEKGRAVKHQRKAFDALLNVRIRLQKGLIAMNTLSAASVSEAAGSQHKGDIYLTAEAAALQLWNQLNQLRRDFQTAVLPTKASNNKRKLEEIDSSTPLLKLWSEMEEQEALARPYRQASLEKWSAKVRGVTNPSLGTRLNNTVHQATITDVLNEHLSNTERLVKRTKAPRSCAPIQAQKGIREASEIYDDADFYQLQLKELVDQRLAESGTSSMTPALNQMAAMREAKTRKKVDTKASKGRKLRYTVHEKLQNFMVPEDRGNWDVRQTDELFGSLLGAKVRLEEDGENMEDGDDFEELAAGGLKLFRS